MEDVSVFENCLQQLRAVVRQEVALERTVSQFHVVIFCVPGFVWCVGGCRQSIWPGCDVLGTAAPIRLCCSHSLQEARGLIHLSEMDEACETCKAESQQVRGLCHYVLAQLRFQCPSSSCIDVQMPSWALLPVQVYKRVFVCVCVCARPCRCLSLRVRAWRLWMCFCALV